MTSCWSRWLNAWDTSAYCSSKTGVAHWNETGCSGLASRWASRAGRGKRAPSFNHCFLTRSLFTLAHTHTVSQTSYTILSCSVSMCVCVCDTKCVCVCVCERERERERENMPACVCVPVYVGGGGKAFFPFFFLTCTRVCYIRTDNNNKHNPKKKGKEKTSCESVLEQDREAGKGLKRTTTRRRSAHQQDSRLENSNGKMKNFTGCIPGISRLIGRDRRQQNELRSVQQALKDTTQPHAQSAARLSAATSGQPRSLPTTKFSSVKESARRVGDRGKFRGSWDKDSGSTRPPSARHWLIVIIIRRALDEWIDQCLLWGWQRAKYRLPCLPLTRPKPHRWESSRGDGDVPIRLAPTDVGGWGPTDVENKIKSLTGVQHCSDQLWLLPAFCCSSFSVYFIQRHQTTMLLRWTDGHTEFGERERHRSRCA